MIVIEKVDVLKALNNVFGSIISEVSFNVRHISTGTVGKIYHINGQAYTDTRLDSNRSFDLILKIQKKM